MFKCPNCKSDMDQVYVTSLCYQIGYLEEEKTENSLKYRIEDYSSVVEILETKKIECQECGFNLKKYIKEN